MVLNGETAQSGKSACLILFLLSFFPFKILFYCSFPRVANAFSSRTVIYRTSQGGGVSCWGVWKDSQCCFPYIKNQTSWNFYMYLYLVTHLPVTFTSLVLSPFTTQDLLLSQGTALSPLFLHAWTFLPSWLCDASVFSSFKSPLKNHLFHEAFGTIS